MTEVRKATDVLLDLELKINTLLNLVRSQDLTIKVLSNKLNSVMEVLEKQKTAPAPKFTVEMASNPNPTIKVVDEKKVIYNPDQQLTVDESPQGFRRTSRPETYSTQPEPKFPTQIPAAQKPAEVIVPNLPNHQITQAMPAKASPKSPVSKSEQLDKGAFPVMQRIVDKNGKSVFMAEIEVLDMANGETVYKTKTNGTGKWSAALPTGDYRIFVRKRESISKDKLEVAQDVKVDGSSPTLELQTMIIRQ